MAVVATYRVIVRTQKGIELMIENRPSPGGGIVTDPAVTGQFGSLVIWIATVAKIGRVARLTTDRGVAVVATRMTTLTWRCPVPPVENEASLNMPERRRNPTLGRMTGVACVRTELIAVRIRVTGYAATVKRRKIPSLMAGLARQAGVTPLQRKRPLLMETHFQIPRTAGVTPGTVPAIKPRMRVAMTIRAGLMLQTAEPALGMTGRTGSLFVSPVTLEPGPLMIETVGPPLTRRTVAAGAGGRPELAPVGLFVTVGAGLMFQAAEPAIGVAGRAGGFLMRPLQTEFRCFVFEDIRTPAAGRGMAIGTATSQECVPVGAEMT